MFKIKSHLCLLFILSIILCSFTGCGSKNSNIILLEEPDPIIYPESYHQVIREFPSDLTVEPITDYMDAADKGQQLWIEQLGDYAADYLDRDIKVFYVAEDDAWAVVGTLPDDYVGYWPIAIIKADGAVLSVFWV